MFNLHSRYFLKELFYRWGRGLRVRWEIGSITCSRSSSGKLSEFKSTCSNHCCVLEKFQMPILPPEMLISFPVLQVYYSTLLCFLIDIHYFPSSAVRSMVSSKSSSLGPSPCLFIDSAQLNDPKWILMLGYSQHILFPIFLPLSLWYSHSPHAKPGFDLSVFPWVPPFLQTPLWISIPMPPLPLQLLFFLLTQPYHHQMSSVSGISASILHSITWSLSNTPIVMTIPLSGRLLQWLSRN